MNKPSPTGLGTDPAASEAHSETSRILEQGYRSYDGPRRGVQGSVSSIVRYSIRCALGLGRPARHKILPWLAMVLAVIPAMVFVGLAALLDADLLAEDILPDYPDYYGFIWIALFFFCGIVVPDILVADRRDGMLSLYLSTPLRRSSYLASKGMAVAITLSIISIGPLLFLLLAYTLEGSGPDGIGGWFTILLRISAGGVAIAAAFAAVSLAAASLTDRRAFAAVGIILLLIFSGVITEILVQGVELRAEIYAFDLGGISDELVQRIYGQTPAAIVDETNTVTDRATLSTGFVVMANLAWVMAGTAVVWLRYRRLGMNR